MRFCEVSRGEALFVLSGNYRGKVKNLKISGFFYKLNPCCLVLLVEYPIKFGSSLMHCYIKYR